MGTGWVGTGWAPASAHVINLARRPDRLAAFCARTAGLPWPVLVAPGVEAASVPEGWGGGVGAWGCALAHQRLLRATAGDTLVFEDDAVPTPELAQLLRAAVGALPTTWELLLLGASDDRYADESGQLLLAPPVRPVAAFLRTHAYLISDRGRPPALEAIGRARRSFDWQLSRMLCARGNTFALNPLPVAFDPALGSDIPDSGPLPPGQPRGAR